jgi:hypothetical protein
MDPFSTRLKKSEISPQKKKKKKKKKWFVALVKIIV